MALPKFDIGGEEGAIKGLEPTGLGGHFAENAEKLQAFLRLGGRLKGNHDRWRGGGGCGGEGGARIRSYIHGPKIKR
jgi:hypothetical protein